MSDTFKKTLGTLVSILLAGTAVVFRNNPVVVAALPSIATFILGALHVQRPGDVKLTEVAATKS